MAFSTRSVARERVSVDLAACRSVTLMDLGSAGLSRRAASGRSYSVGSSIASTCSLCPMGTPGPTCFSRCRRSRIISSTALRDLLVWWRRRPRRLLYWVPAETAA